MDPSSLIRADHALYAFAMVVIIAVNLGGLGLLFTLRGQIQCASPATDSLLERVR